MSEEHKISTPPVALGQLFADRFNLIELLGSGGMGDVYLAEDSLLGGEKVALKILHRDLSEDEEHARRFLRELKVTRQVTHPNVVRTFDFGESDGRPYFSMELVRGTTLKALLDDGPLTADQTVSIIRQIIAALDVIHAARIIHRDLKPSNVLLLPDGLVKVMDFGVARPAMSELISRQGVVVGSALYMAPEQWVGNEVGPATDYYALGVTWYELLTGVTPFESASHANLMYLHMQKAPTPPADLVETIPGPVNSMILGLLAKDPVKRSLTMERVRRYVSIEEQGARPAEREVAPEPAVEPEVREELVPLEYPEEMQTDRAASWLEEDAFVPLRSHRPLLLHPQVQEKRRGWARLFVDRSLRAALSAGAPLLSVCLVAALLVVQSAIWEAVQEFSLFSDPRNKGVGIVILTSFIAVLSCGFLVAVPWIGAAVQLRPRRLGLKVAFSTAMLGPLVVLLLSGAFVTNRYLTTRQAKINFPVQLAAASLDATVVVTAAVTGRVHSASARTATSYSRLMRPEWYTLAGIIAFGVLWLLPLCTLRAMGTYLARKAELAAVSAMMASVFLFGPWIIDLAGPALSNVLQVKQVVLYVGLTKVSLTTGQLAYAFLWYFQIAAILLALSRARAGNEGR